MLWDDHETVNEGRLFFQSLRFIHVLPGNSQKKMVDPTRLELVTSAMRRRFEGYAEVRDRSEMRWNKLDSKSVVPWKFAVVRFGCRQTVVADISVLVQMCKQSILGSAPC